LILGVSTGQGQHFVSQAAGATHFAQHSQQWCHPIAAAKPNNMPIAKQ
jgi:hypothetical protein